jgi:asparagine synthase (glutamine-hydrolysing)
MCGITAIFSSRKQPDNIISAIHSVLLHRGPDYQNAVHLKTGENNHLYLLHNRLSIVDLSEAGIQPMYDEESGVYLIFNGEIYNFREIRNALKEEGFTFKSHSDSEVLLKSYICWGKNVVTKLNGMFAFMIWDTRTNRMFIARDRFGEKPLYYGHTKTGDVIFSSEMKAIRAFPNFEAKVNHQFLEDFVSGIRSPLSSNALPFENIFQVPPATCIELSHQGHILNSYQFWSAQRSPLINVGGINEKEATEEFLFLLAKSVRNRGNCDVQFGACLSGGLDSTSIVGLLMKDKPDHFSSTISVCYDNDATISEGNYLRDATDYFKGNHVFITPTGNEFLSDIEKIFWHQEYPVPSASMFLEWSVMKKAQEVNNIVMLDGQGSDELLGGYPYYFKLYQREMLYEKEYKELIKNTYLFRKYLKEISLEYVDAERRIPTGTSYSFKELAEIHFKNKIKKFLYHNKSQELNLLRKNQSFTHIIEEGLSKTTLQEQLHSSDRNGMAFSIETRFPFLDYDLVDFSLKVPVKRLISEGMQKNILRQAMRGIIPEKILLRKDKLGFLAPQDTWLKEDLKGWCFDMITNSCLSNLSYYSKENALNVFSNFHKAPTPSLSNQLWRFASLGQWISIFGSKT